MEITKSSSAFGFADVTPTSRILPVNSSCIMPCWSCRDARPIIRRLSSQLLMDLEVLPAPEGAVTDATFFWNGFVGDNSREEGRHNAREPGERMLRPILKDAGMEGKSAHTFRLGNTVQV